VAAAWSIAKPKIRKQILSLCGERFSRTIRALNPLNHPTRDFAKVLGAFLPLRVGRFPRLREQKRVAAGRMRHQGNDCQSAVDWFWEGRGEAADFAFGGCIQNLKIFIAGFLGIYPDECRGARAEAAQARRWPAGYYRLALRLLRSPARWQQGRGGQPGGVVARPGFAPAGAGGRSHGAMARHVMSQYVKGSDLSNKKSC